MINIVQETEKCCSTFHLHFIPSYDPESFHKNFSLRPIGFEWLCKVAACTLNVDAAS